MAGYGSMTVRREVLGRGLEPDDCYFVVFFQAEDGIRDHCVTGVQTCALPIFGNPFAGVSHSFSKSLGGEPGEQWVNPNAFATPASGPGNLGRNAFYGPGFGDVDVSVIKNIGITERMKLQLRAEMFNVFNRINLATGAGSVGSDGTVRDTIGDFNGAPGLGPGEPFNLQLAAKIIF